MQTCRGSHTHTLLDEPDDDENVYVYVSGHRRRPLGDGAARGCNGTHPADGREPVPLADRGDQGAAGRAADGGRRQRAAPVHGRGDRRDQRPAERAADAAASVRHALVAVADHRLLPRHHTFPALDLAAGACEGNGLLIDISDPANPVRIDEVADPNFAYWHGATFSNDGTKVVFTDEWGGGTAARCRATDQPSWGANAIFDIVDGQILFRSYYKLPVAQTNQENCVAPPAVADPGAGPRHLVQAWYQGGVSLVDFTDSANPEEIALLRPRPDQRRRPGARRPLVDVLVQR